MSRKCEAMDEVEQYLSVDGDALSALVIEDDEFVRQVTARTLRQLGCDPVLEAADGRAALTTLEAHSSDVDLILCDLEMPGVDGIEVLRLLSNIRTKAGILIVSSHREQVLRAAEELAHGYGLHLLGSVSKPLRRTDVERLLPKLGRDEASSFKQQEFQLTPERLDQAIANHELTLYYQPKARTEDRKVVGLEALIRWDHPDHGIIGPGAFIPMAESSDRIGAVTDWVINRAVEECVPVIQQQGIQSVSVNISVNALRDLKMPDRIASAVKEAGLRPDNLVLEVTESGLMEDVRTSLNILSRLTINGFKLSIDDFGTGYSSLQQLLRIPFAELKLDRSFVDGAAGHRIQRVILESTVDLARRLDLQTVAEGVETSQDIRMVAECGVPLIQGYFIQKPLPMADLRDWLK